MKFFVYTDGAHRLGSANIAASFYIRTGKDYITMKTFALHGRNAVVAECLAIGLACEWLLNNKPCLSKEDTIVMISDSKAAMDIVNRVRDMKSNITENHADVKNKEESRNNIKNPSIALAIEQLEKLKGKCNVDFQKIKAHKNTINGNYVADRLAKCALALAGV